MGADLYVKGYEKHRAACGPKWEAAIERRNALPPGPEHDKAQAEVEELFDAMHSPEWYFRDSYNSTSLFWRLGLSWWKDLEPYYLPEAEQTDDVNIGPDGCKALAILVAAAPLEPFTAEELAESGWNESLTEVNAYFTAKHKALVRFLRIGAEAGGIFASC